MPEAGTRTGSGFLFGDSLSFSCRDGYYQSVGPEDGVRTCQESGLWSDVQPVCSGGDCNVLYAHSVCLCALLLMPTVTAHVVGTK